MKESITLHASEHPREVIEGLARRPEQPKTMRQYRGGYEEYFNTLPTLSEDDPILDLKTKLSGEIMKGLAGIVSKDRKLMHTPPDGKFARVILAVADPEGGHEGSEILIAQWGKGFTSPVHGHAPGLLHEDIILGKILVHNYRYVGGDLVRPVSSEVVGPGTLVSKYSAPSKLGPRMGLIHNFVAIEPTVTLHFVPEHTRDGRDNQFRVEHFSDFDESSVEQLDIQSGLLLQIGDVALVRSANVAEYGDHFIVVTGGPILKPHGLRPADVAIQAGPTVSRILEHFEPVGRTGLTLLKLDSNTARRMLEFHNIQQAGNVLFFPKA